MVLTELIFSLIVFAALGLFGIHLIKNNHVITTNLSKNASVFATKVIENPQSTPITARKWILSRVMVYIVGLSFVLVAVMGVVVSLKPFF